MSGAPDVLAAKARAEAARLQLDGTLAELKAKLQPANIVHNAWSTTVDRGADAWDVTVERSTEGLALAVDKATEAGEAAVAYAQKRPAVVAGFAGAAVALLAGPSIIRRVFRRAPPKPIPTDPPRLTGPIPHLETRP